MKTKSFLRILAMLGVVSIALTGAVFGQSSGNSQAKPKLVIQTVEHSFGEIKKGSVAQHSFTFKNEGKANLEITRVTPSCGCTASDYTKVVPPGKEGKVTLTFNSAGFNGAVTKSAEVYTNDPENPQFTLMMSAVIASDDTPQGTRVGPFIVGPTNQWSGRAPRGSSVNGLITVTNTTQPPIRITKLDPNGSVFEAKLQTLEEGKRYSVSFASPTTLSIGSHTQTVKLTTDSKETPELELQLEAVVISPVSVSPTSLVFENVPVSNPEMEISLVSKFLWVRVGRSAGLEVKSITSDLPFIKVKTEMSDPNGSSITLRVGFSEKPPKGTHTGKIKIETNNADVKAVEVPITVNAQ
jgi:hypothetical protein